MKPSPTAPRIHLVSTLKNEGPYLVEWLAYHKAIGVTDITLFSNDCTDGTNLMLDRLAQMGELSHFDNPIGPGIDPQRRAYSRAGKMEAVREADYVLIVDADEFVNVHVGGETAPGPARTLPALIDACGHPDAISLCWRLMGSGGTTHWVDAPVLGRFPRGSAFDPPANGMVWGFKTLFRPAAFDYFGVHRPKFDRKVRQTIPLVRWVNGSGDDMGPRIAEKGWRFNADTLGTRHAHINHYAIKSREEFLLKRLRGTANSKDKSRIDLDYWDRYDLHDVADETPPLAPMLGEAERLLSDPDLAALRRACIETSRRVLAGQLADPDLRAFVEAPTGAAQAATP
ncbi:MAG: glycosyltransferase family 2 protein [Pseudomonadota bacterium]